MQHRRKSFMFVNFDFSILQILLLVYLCKSVMYINSSNSYQSLRTDLHFPKNSDFIFILCSINQSRWKLFMKNVAVLGCMYAAHYETFRFLKRKEKRRTLQSVFIYFKVWCSIKMQVHCIKFEIFQFNVTKYSISFVRTRVMIQLKVMKT